MQLCELNREVGTWSSELKWALRKIKGKSLISIILSMAWKALVYHVWRERNRRMHNQANETVLQVFECIKKEIRIKLAGLLNVKGDDVNRKLCRNWGLNIELLS